MQNVLLFTTILVLFVVGSVRGEEFTLRNGSTIRGEITSLRDDAVAINVERRGVVMYPLSYFSTETAERLKILIAEDRANNIAEGKFRNSVRDGTQKILTPDQVQTSAFSLKGEILLMKVEDPRVQEIKPGIVELRWLSLRAELPAPLAKRALESDVVFVKVTIPEKWDSTIEILGDSPAFKKGELTPFWNQKDQ